MSGRKRQKAIDSIQGEVTKLVRGTRGILQSNAADWEADLPPAAFAIMTYIALQHPVSPATIIAATALDRSVVSRQLGALTRAGYLAAEPDPTDGRVALFSPTPTAAEQFAGIRASNRQRLDAAFGDWSDEDLTALATVLDRFNGAIRRI